MLLRTYWPICLALCAFGCVAQVDFSGLDAGAGTDGLTTANRTIESSCGMGRDRAVLQVPTFSVLMLRLTVCVLVA